MSGRQRVVLHVGLPKTGTTHLQATLAEHREVLAGRGVCYPDLGPEAMFRGAVEVRGSHEAFGLSAADVAGRWQALAERAHRHPGTTVISHEVLAGAQGAELDRATAPLAGLDVHVVVTARDLGSLATAFWQERVKLGEPWTFAELSRVQIEPELRGERPEPRAMFWHAYDLADCVRRWAGVVGTGNVHVVTVPPAGSPPGELWRRFCAAAGLAEAAADLPPAAGGRASNVSLGRTQVALLREVHAAVGDRMSARERALAVKRRFAEGVLPGLGDREPARSPAALQEPFAAVTRSWLEVVRDLGVELVGDARDLDPVCGAATDPHPDQVDREEVVALAAGAVVALLLDPGPARPVRPPRRGTWVPWRRGRRS